ncbi:MAG: hypothetical protein IJD18_03035 [Clostridia bacterium]|nr:hypothetical protein [Clostridia bacterium]
MSNLVAFLVYDTMEYEEMVAVSKSITKYCLNKDIGAIFNFLGYSEKLITELNPNFYFSISDDFLQLNSEWLSTSSIENIAEEEGKVEFCNKFSFLEDICAILDGYGLQCVKLLVSSSGTESIEDFLLVDAGLEPITNLLYKSVIENHATYAYGFPDIIINLKKNT